jgi:hypothetical protein
MHSAPLFALCNILLKDKLIEFPYFDTFSVLGAFLNATLERK